MARRQALAKVRNLLIAKASELGNPGASSDTVVAAVLKEHPEAVLEARDDLVRMALARELSRARERGPTSVGVTQLTLWGNFNVSPQIRVSNEHGELVYKNLDICTFEEVEEYATSLPTPRNRSNRRANLLQMVETLKPFRTSEKDFIGTSWATSIAGSAKGVA
ncbi:hypothetical protein [Mesorhizobium sp. M0207]|uniref:hypothetical protein n=1 Tax=Mesorhizobium sp. M0207 TaxID=2956915 RepID=UPI00333CC5D5